MDKIYMSNQIKLEILNICGHPTVGSYNLDGKTALAVLGYHSQIHFKMLEDKLQTLATYYNTGKIITPGVISKDFTVNECIRLILL